MHAAETGDSDLITVIARRILYLRLSGHCKIALTMAKNLPQDDTTSTKLPSQTRHYIVGIGSSAGGLEALSSLIAALPDNLGLSYVVVQHLSPTHKNMLVQLLGRETSMAVCEIQDQMVPQIDVIHIAPASRNTIFKDDRFILMEAKRETLPKPSADVFLTSLANEKTEDAIGIILSGTGSDGTVGLREIKSKGGFTFVQDPSTAKYTGMPQSAIDSGCVDWVLSPEKIASKITSIVRNRTTISQHVELKQPQSIETKLKRLLISVKQKTRIDFGGYKEGTLWRRIERRMAINHFINFDDYLKFTEDTPAELEQLSKDILISVTEFFRDQEAFTQLKHTIKTIASNKQAGDEIRIWIPACATGEEAYSIAILLAETLGTNLSRYKIQIFATDIDSNAMSLARKGSYTEGSLVEVEHELVNRYFTAQQGRYEISRTIREMVVFARQDLVLDPPFLRIDLISCRNVLIYLQAELQAKIFATFHFGLMEKGYLFLGKSESIYQQDNLFDIVDKNYHIYRRRSSACKIPASSIYLPHLNQKSDLSPNKKNNTEQRLLEFAIRKYIPPSILVNDNLDIQHLFGEVCDYLTISQGKPSTNLTHMIRRELRSDLQLLQHKSDKSMDSAIGRPRQIRIGKSNKTIRLAMHPTEKGFKSSDYLVCFEECPIQNDSSLQVNGNATKLDADTKLNIRELEDELIMTRERLQTVIEELETSNEELQALNEEVQSSNEELQTSNEEMEATNEELQSTNEELTTINEELQIRTNELAETLNDLEIVQNSVGFPIIVVNEQLKILRFNAPAATLFLMKQSAIGHHFGKLKLPIGMKDFSDQVQDAIHLNKVIESAISSLEHHYLLHIAPYETAMSNIPGAIITLVDDTERRATEEEISASREKLLSIMNNSTSIIALKDIAGRYEFVNQQFEDTFNIELKNILGKTDREFLSQSIAEDFRIKELEVVRKLQPIETEDHLHFNNQEIYLLSIRFPLIGSDNLPYGVCTQFSDITSRVKAESQLRLAAKVFDRSSEGIVVTNQMKQVLTVNEAFTKITGFSSDEVIGKPPSFMTNGLQDDAFIETIWNNIETQGSWQGEILNRRKNGDTYPEWLTVNAIQNHSGKISNYVAILSDITVIKESQQRIEFLATHDSLTELPNRLLFLDRIKQAIARGDRGDYLFAVLFIDLDDFKTVNDSLGHATGDKLLKDVAKLMRGLVRAVDTVARFGGDEFALLIENTTVREVEIAARRLCAAISRAFFLSDQMIHIGASVGIAIFPEDSKDAEILMKHADTAMYEAKAKGKNSFQFFTQSMMEQVNKRLRLENNLRKALDNNELSLHYQPQIDLATGELIGVEALVRWPSQEQEAKLPNQFVPIAEKCGLIEKLGEWVADNACSQLSRWLKRGYTFQHLSINISIDQFRRGNVFGMMERLLKVYQLPAQKIMLEITESTLADDNQSMLETLLRLKKMGIKISIDDFGTGYSSLARLKSYPIDELKIDRSFVDDITEQGQNRTIAQTIIAMSKTLGFSVVAEGVETQEQLETLRELGCDIIQGYLISEPISAKAFAHKFHNKLH